MLLRTFTVCIWSPGTIFAYGQTSSGKTFTMMGSGRVPGVIPLAVEEVFQTIKHVINVSLLFTCLIMMVHFMFFFWPMLLFSFQRRSSFSGFLTWRSTTKLWPISWLTAGRENRWKSERPSTYVDEEKLSMEVFQLQINTQPNDWRTAVFDEELFSSASMNKFT